VFVTDQVTGRLVQRTFDGSWGGWVDRGLGPGGHRLASSAAASWGVGRIDVLARDEVTNDLVHFWLSGTRWYGPQRLAGSPGGRFAPSVASWSARRLDVFAVTSAGSLAQFWFDGHRWWGWSDKGRGPGGAALSPPAAVSAWGPGRLDVFASASAGRVVAHRWFDRGWHGPQGLGTGLDRIRLAGLGATSWDVRRLDVVATDQQSRSLVQLYFDGGWHGPVRLDLNTDVSVMVDTAPRLTPLVVDQAARAAD
jgi:hypothetical protein